MQTLEITRATTVAGRHVAPGEIIELTDNDAKTLIALGKAVPVMKEPVADNREKEKTAKISKRAKKKAQS